MKDFMLCLSPFEYLSTATLQTCYACILIALHSNPRDDSFCQITNEQLQSWSRDGDGQKSVLRLRR